jgi:hypothetical protein
VFRVSDGYTEDDLQQFGDVLVMMTSLYWFIDAHGARRVCMSHHPLQFSCVDFAYFADAMQCTDIGQLELQLAPTVRRAALLARLFEPLPEPEMFRHAITLVYRRGRQACVRAQISDDDDGQFVECAWKRDCFSKLYTEALKLGDGTCEAWFTVTQRDARLCELQEQRDVIKADRCVLVGEDDFIIDDTKLLQLPTQQAAMIVVNEFPFAPNWRERVLGFEQLIAASGVGRVVHHTVHLTEQLHWKMFDGGFSFAIEPPPAAPYEWRSVRLALLDLLLVLAPPFDENATRLPTDVVRDLVRRSVPYARLCRPHRLGRLIDGVCKSVQEVRKARVVAGAGAAKRHTVMIAE